MNVIRLMPVHISTLFLAARFFRARNFPLLAVAVGVAVILPICRRWVPRVVQIALIVGGAEWTMQSDMDGSGTWYFAYKEGILVSDVTEGTADGNIVVQAPNGEMTIPVSRDYSMITKLMK